MLQPCMCGATDCPRCFPGGEIPEECLCGATNTDEDGEWVYPPFPGACSEECATSIGIAQEAADEARYEAWEDEYGR